MRASTLIYVLWIVFSKSKAWVNRYDKPFRFTCADNGYISYITSQHNNHYEDRVWGFRCSPFPVYDNTANIKCTWSGFVNDFDRPLRFRCPDGAALNGVYSYHNNKREDRRWRFRCCRKSDITIKGCKLTPYVNWWDRTMHYLVPFGNVISGVISYHHNHYEDRRWKFDICKSGK